MNEYDQYRARIELAPDEAAALLTGALQCEGFRIVEVEGSGIGLEYGPSYDLRDTVAITRGPNRSVHVDITRFGWRFDEDSFVEPHYSTLEFIAVVNGGHTEIDKSNIELDGWVRETFVDYLLPLGERRSNETVITSYGLPYQLYLRSMADNLGELGWEEGSSPYPGERVFTDGKGGKASIATQDPDTIAQIESDVEGHHLSERFVISPCRGRTVVHISGNSPLLSLDFVDGVTQTAFKKSALGISL